MKFFLAVCCTLAFFFLGGCGGGSSSNGGIPGAAPSLHSGNALEVLASLSLATAPAFYGWQDLVDVGVVGSAGQIYSWECFSGTATISHNDVNGDGRWGTGEDLSVVYSDCTNMFGDAQNGSMIFTDVVLTGDWAEQINDYAISAKLIIDYTEYDNESGMTRGAKGTTLLTESVQGVVESFSSTGESFSFFIQSPSDYFDLGLYPSLEGLSHFNVDVSDFSIFSQVEWNPGFVGKVAEHYGFTARLSSDVFIDEYIYTTPEGPIGFVVKDDSPVFMGKLVVTAKSDGSRAFIEFDGLPMIQDETDIVRISLDHNADGTSDDQIEVEAGSLAMIQSLGWGFLLLLAAPLLGRRLRRQ